MIIALDEEYIMIKLHELAGSAWFNMTEEEKTLHQEGIKFALENLPAQYEGTSKGCMQYLTDKINIATNNATIYYNNTELYLGSIALYNAMVKELL